MGSRVTDNEAETGAEKTSLVHQCEVKLYSTTVPRDHALSYTLPQDTKTRIRGRVHSFWVTGNDCCWEIRRKRKLKNIIRDNDDKWIHIKKRFVIRKCEPEIKMLNDYP